MQLLPSPMLGMGSGGARFGMSWQLTPVSYSWGLNRKVSPWRFLVVEPHARQGGSIEAFVTPEIFFGPKVSPAVRPGVRAYFPVLSRGEYLSLSLGTSYQRIDGRDAVALEAGAYVLFGIVGLQVSQVPAPDTPLSTIATIRLRYF